MKHSMSWVKKGKAVGKLNIEFDGTLSVDGKKLPESAVLFIIDWGFKQPLTNSYADKDCDPVEKWTKLLNKIMAGDVVPGDGGTTTDPVVEEMRRLALPEMFKALGVKSESAARKKLGKSYAATLNMIVTQFEADLRPDAEEIVKNRTPDKPRLKGLEALLNKA